VVIAGDGLLRGALSRRRLLGIAGAGVAAGASGALLAGCGDDTKSAAAQTTPDESDAADVELLNSVLDLELMVVAAYKAAAARLRGSNLRIAQGFLEQEQAHADAVAAAIRDLRGTPNGPRSTYRFPRLRSQDAAMRFAVGLENTVIAAYIDALPKFSQADLRSTAAAIVTCEAEHVAVLRGALGQPQAPAAFVVGRAA
jgi:bacterioferritin (cytochrome b1)